MTQERGNRRREIGYVISDKPNKTVTVEVRRLVRHPKYGKYMTQRTRCHVHDENNDAKVGDRVEIVEARRMSKSKRGRLMSVLEKASS